MSKDTPRRSSVPVELAGLEAGYGGHGLLPAVDLEIESGQMWALIGRNGSGKTTLLRTILGLLPSVGGLVIRDKSSCVSYIPQRTDYDLAVPARVIDIVREGLDHHRSFLSPFFVGRHAADVQRALEETGTKELAHRRFRELSEGQRQRVLIAKAIVCDPGLIVLDEPTSAMDPLAERSMFELLDRLRRSRDLAVLVASHSMSMLPQYSTHAVLVDADAQQVVAGPIHEVLESEAFRRIYGFRAAAET